MNVKDKVGVVTGGASGIGLGLCTRFAQEGAHVVLSDLARRPASARPRRSARSRWRPTSVAKRTSRTSSRPRSTTSGGSTCSSPTPGSAIDGGIDIATDKWQKIINVNLMSEIWAAKYAIPHMLEQGSGYLLNIASAAGLLVIFDTVSYTVTKHAAIGFTEWLAATYDDQGIGVSVLVPAAVQDADPGRQGGHPGGPGRDHHGASSPRSSFRGSPRSGS